MTTAAIVVALAGAACFGLSASLAARRLPPRHATWLISVGAVASALSGLVVQALLAFVVVGQLPLFADEGRWSSAALHHHAFTEPGVGVVALAALLVAAVALLLALRCQVVALAQAYRACRGMPGGLVVLRDGPTTAVAVPGRPGRIVVAESLLSALSPGERRVLLAHEQAHLEHGHHWHRAAVALAAAANPLLAPLRAAIRYTTERWADEQAARRVGSRRAVATTVARVAVLTSARPGPAQLAAAAEAVPTRVAALLTRPVRPRPVLSAVLIAIPLIAAFAAGIVWEQTESLFDLAVRLYR